jgi:hypothetical protein
MINRKFAKADLNVTNYTEEDYKFVSEREANLVTSLIGDVISTRQYHAPVLDIDIPHKLVPSSTVGHSHLYLDIKCTWTAYEDFLWASEKIGLLEEGYVKASLHRGFTAVRKPGIYK